MCVGMSNIYRFTTRRPPVSARPAPLADGVIVTSPARIEALRRLVAAGQYQVSPRWLATKIFRAAGLTMP